MSGQQQNVWQARSSQQQFRNNNNNNNNNNPSRTPQNRSSTASPNPASTPTNAPAKPQESSHLPPRNVWATKQQERPARNGPTVNSAFAPQQQQQQQQTTNTFNVEDASVLLKRKSVAAPYRPAGAGAAANKPSGDKMANGQSFFATLAKQVASLEAGG